MSVDNYPNKSIYCPISDAHAGRFQHLLFALSDDALFVKCKEHDWMRIEMRSNGRKITYENLSIVASPVQPEKEMPFVIFKNLQPVPIYAKGDFKLRVRDKRKEMTLHEPICCGS